MPGPLETYAGNLSLLQGEGPLSQRYAQTRYGQDFDQIRDSLYNAQRKLMGIYAEQPYSVPNPLTAAGMGMISAPATAENPLAPLAGAAQGFIGADIKRRQEDWQRRANPAAMEADAQLQRYKMGAEMLNQADESMRTEMASMAAIDSALAKLRGDQAEWERRLPFQEAEEARKNQELQLRRAELGIKSRQQEVDEAKTVAEQQPLSVRAPYTGRIYTGNPRVDKSTLDVEQKQREADAKIDVETQQTYASLLPTIRSVKADLQKSIENGWLNPNPIGNKWDLAAVEYLPVNQNDPKDVEKANTLMRLKAGLTALATNSRPSGTGSVSDFEQRRFSEIVGQGNYVPDVIQRGLNAMEEIPAQRARRAANRNEYFSRYNAISGFDAAHIDYQKYESSVKDKASPMSFSTFLRLTEQLPQGSSIEDAAVKNGQQQILIKKPDGTLEAFRVE